jgi:DNA-binding transcriptional MerR regulator
MSKPRSKEKIDKSETVSIGELAELSDTRYSTLKHYTEIGLLEFKQIDSGLKRQYPKQQSLERLEKIKALKTEKRLTIAEIVDYFNTNKVS